MKTIYRLAAATVALALAAAPASAQQGGANVQRAAAVVNDLVISTFDLDQRTRLVLSSAGGAQGPEAQARIREQVLRTLIDELLQLQEAEKAEISVGEKDVDEALARIAQQNNTTPQAILNSLAGAGVYAATLKNQIKAELAWSRLIEERLAPRVNLTDEEIDEEMRRIEAGATKPRFLVSEIFFAVDSPDDEARVRQNIERLFQQLQTGTPFPVLAQQFSESSTASRGGDIGWVQDGDVAPEVWAALQEMRPQTISRPIRATGGFYLLALRDKMRPAGSAADAPPPPPVRPAGVPAGSVKLKRLVFGLPPGMSKAQQQQAIEAAMRLRSAIRGCQGLEEFVGQLQGVLLQDLPVIPIRDLSEGFQQVLQGVGPSEVSMPFFSEEGPGQEVMNLLVVCGDRLKEEYVPTQVFEMPSRDSVANRMFNQELSVMARRYMRDLRRDAAIEIREGNPRAVRGAALAP